MDEVIDILLDPLEEEEHAEPYASLMSSLDDESSNENLLDIRRLPEKTAIQVDSGLTVALKRNMKYRGRAVLKYRSSKVHPGSGVVRMLNRGITRPPGVNEIVRINPKYNIVLEPRQQPEGTSCLDDNQSGNEMPPATQGDPNTRYVLREELPVAAVSAQSGLTGRWNDPCSTNVYTTRFEGLKETLIRNVEETWPNDIAVPISQAKDFLVSFFDFGSWTSGEVETKQYVEDKDCRVIVLIGVLISFRPMADKHIGAVCRRHRILHLPTRPATAEMYKTMYLVDCDGKEGIRLFAQPSSGLNPDEIVSGIPCALKGFAVSGNGFVVSQVIWPTPGPCSAVSLDPCLRLDIIFVSGIKLSSKASTSAELDLLCDYLLGLSGCPDEQLCEMLPKSKIFFLGNSFDVCDDENSEKYAENVLSISSRLDAFFNKIAETMEVFLLPGKTDPSEKLLPQKPFQPVMFPRLSNCPWAHCYHNPCRLKMKILNGESVHQPLDMILSSGSNIGQVRKYLGDESALILGERMLKWGHLNPASPDLYPYEPECVDRMVIQEPLPQYYFIGNQDKFGVREFHGTQIISVPSFSSSHQIVTMQINDGSCKVLPVEFKTFL